MSKKLYKAIDFFCGGGGMTHGLCQAGIKVIAGVDFDIDAKETYEFNNPGSRFINTDIKRLRSNYFEKHFHLVKNDDSLIFVGCSPCQYYSVINTAKTKSVKSKNLLMSFARFIEYYNPGYVVVENVPGIMTNKDSILPKFLKRLSKLGYNNVVYKVINLCKYGVPQSRRRFSLIATRIEGVKLSLPKADDHISILKDFIGEEHGFHPINAGYKDATDFNHTAARLNDICLKRIRKTKTDGGCRLDWADDPELQLPCFVGKDSSFKDTFGRMWWNKPAPTITTKFFSLSNGRFGHPTEDRAISIREGATLQTFPSTYVFKTKSIAATAKLIGNAVPCEYARRIGDLIINL